MMLSRWSLPFIHKAKYFGLTANNTDSDKDLYASETDWLKVEFHDEDGHPKFGPHHYVVGFPNSVDECHICQIGSSYYYTGLGFNIQPAGVAVTSAYLEKDTPRAAAGKWSTALRWRDGMPSTVGQRG
jgi:hypothetical protein